MDITMRSTTVIYGCRTLILGTVVVALAGCAGETCLSKASFTGNIAKYSLAQDHKAVYLNTDPKSHFLMNFTVGRPSAQMAQVDAETECRNYAVKGNYEVSKCFPVAVDNKQTVFNPTALYCEATPQTSVADQADLMNALSNLNNSIKR
jgi:hypothetical protein